MAHAAAYELDSENPGGAGDGSSAPALGAGVDNRIVIVDATGAVLGAAGVKLNPTTGQFEGAGGSSSGLHLSEAVGTTLKYGTTALYVGAFLRLQGFLQYSAATPVASATTITLVPGGSGYTPITGTNGISYITKTGMVDGVVARLQFAGILTITPNGGAPPGTAAPILTRGGLPVTTAAGMILEFQYDGTGVQWVEVGR